MLKKIFYISFENQQIVEEFAEYFRNYIDKIQVELLNSIKKMSPIEQVNKVINEYKELK